MKGTFAGKTRGVAQPPQVTEKENLKSNDEKKAKLSRKAFDRLRAKMTKVQFSNGTIQNADRLDFAFYKSVDEANPKKRLRRMLVAESDRLSYVGSNFGTGSFRCASLCNYYVGVLNKTTMEMELHSAQLFKMQPCIPGESTEIDKSQDAHIQTYREKLDSLTEAFGTVRQKRALSSRRLNDVGKETLQKAMTKAASDVIDHKGLEALKEELSQGSSQIDFTLYLPPRNPDADRPKDVYAFDDLLSPAEYESLADGGLQMAALTPEELQIMKEEKKNLSVLKLLESLPSEGEAREKTLRCAFYLNMLLKFGKQDGKFTSKKDGCPSIIHKKMRNDFAVQCFKKGWFNSVVSPATRAKLTAHCLALLLHVGSMCADLTLLQRDLNVAESWITKVAKAMGLTLSKTVKGAPRDEHKIAFLILPLVKYAQSSERGAFKRRR